MGEPTWSRTTRTSFRVDGEAQHRLDEVGAADAEEPGGADDEVALVGGRGRLLPGELGAAVGRERRGLVGLDVGRALGCRRRRSRWRRRRRWRRPRPRPRRRRCRRRSPLTAQRGLLGLLGAVDVGPGGAVDDDVGALELELGAERAGVGDVELGVAEADHVVAGVAGGEHHVAAEHPGGAGDEELHQGGQAISAGRLENASLTNPARLARAAIAAKPEMWLSVTGASFGR